MTQATNTTESYTYDPVGNRLSSLGVSPYNVNVSNQLTSTPSTSYTYDYNGNTATKADSTGTTSYAWDFENRLTSVMLPGSGGTVSFKYDPFGRRIYKSSSAGTSVYAYDGQNLIEETNLSGAVVARYAQTESVDEPLAMLRSSTTSYYHADGLGSVTSLSSSTGSLPQTYVYDSFGKLTASTGSLVNTFRYTGREFDTETNLQFSRARYFDQNAGRFVSEDPIRFKAGTNFYHYADNNPVVANDPLGLKSCVWIGDTDLYSDWTNENPRNGPWIFAGAGKMSGSRGPWAGGAPPAAAPPAGVRPGGGIPFAIPNCMWVRERTYDQIETTYFAKNYLCFEISACGKSKFWLESKLAKRREFRGTKTIIENIIYEFDWFFDAPIYTELKCLQYGPPNW